MTITLITGGNKGLGYETARRLLEAGRTSGSGRVTQSAGRRRPRRSVRASCSST
ncbi:hypothetical protein [Gryllotalpicola daejeonensis]|uniref:hypothetical protein n=1 Tax=Gryllotalpicola daejeonensis TaxID=993087 RepID=UPI0031D4EB23